MHVEISQFKSIQINSNSYKSIQIKTQYELNSHTIQTTTSQYRTVGSDINPQSQYKLCTSIHINTRQYMSIGINTHQYTSIHINRSNTDRYKSTQMDAYQHTAIYINTHQYT